MFNEISANYTCETCIQFLNLRKTVLILTVFKFVQIRRRRVWKIVKLGRDAEVSLLLVELLWIRLR